MRLRYALVGILVLSTIIGGVFASQYMTELALGTMVHFETVYWGANATGFQQPDRYVIQNQTMLGAIWNTAFCSGLDPCPSAPTINFDTSTIIAVFYGSVPTSGYSTNITEIRETSSTLTVTIVDAEPSSACPTIQGTQYPFHIVSIPKNSRPVSFQETVSLNRCYEDPERR